MSWPSQTRSFKNNKPPMVGFFMGNFVNNITFSFYLTINLLDFSKVKNIFVPEANELSIENV